MIFNMKLAAIMEVINEAVAKYINTEFMSLNSNHQCLSEARVQVKKRIQNKSKILIIRTKQHIELCGKKL